MVRLTATGVLVAFALIFTAAGAFVAPQGALAADASIEARLQRLEDESAIRQKLQDYMSVLASRDWDTYVTYFTDDAAIVMTEGTVVGHEAIKTRMANASARMAKAAEGRPQRRSADILSVESLNVTGDTATATSRFTFIRETDDMQFRVGGSGLYIDKWRKVNGVWLIAERIVDYDMLPGAPQAPRPVRQK